MSPITAAPSRPPDSRFGRYRITLPLLLLVVLFPALVIYQLYISNLAAQLAAKTAANNFTQTIESKLNTDFSAAEHALSWMVSEIETSAMRREMVSEYSPGISHWLKGHLGSISSASALRYFDIEGDWLYSSTDDEPAINIADRPFFSYLKAHPESPTIFSDVALGRATRRPIFYAAKPVVARDGAFLGVAVVAIDLGSIRQQFGTIDLGRDGVVALRRLDNGAAVVGYPGPLDADQQPVLDLAARQAVLLGEAFGTLDATLSPVDPVSRIYGYRKVGEFPFFITVGIAESDYLAGWRKDSAALIVLSMLFLVLLCIAESRRNRREKTDRAIIDASPVPSAVNDGQGHISYFNAAFTETFGYTLLDIPTVEKWWLTAFANPEYRQWVADLWQARLETSRRNKAPFEAMEIQVRTKSGELRTVLCSASQIDSSSDSRQLVTLYDITARKAIEEALKNSEDLLRLSESQMAASQELGGTGSWVYDLETKRVRASAQSLVLFGLPSVAGDYPLDDFLACIDDRQRVAQTLAAAISGERAYDEEFVISPADGSPARVIHSLGWLEKDERGNPARILGFIQDVTARQQAEIELKAAKEAAETANIAKNQFLATMSHEIRTPMNGILGMAQLLMMAQITDAQRLNYARTVLDSGQTLLALLNDILDISKIEAGKFVLEQISFAPALLVDEISAIFAGAAQRKNISLERSWSGPECRYVGDPRRLRQMISNLVGNALKFTEQGAVRIEAREIDRDESGAVLEFLVADSGVGIAQDKLRRLFSPFSPGDSSTTRQYGGSGLGLSIVSRLAQLMEGEVGVESEAGRGSRFWFRIRVGLVDAGAPSGQVASLVRQEDMPGAGPVQFSGQVLVVEDMLVNRTIIEIFLKKLGLSVATAEDGQQAVDRIMHGESADLVLMDIQMPVMGGDEALRRIRQWEREQGRSRQAIVALTANAFEEDRQRYLALGFDGVLTKPIAFDEVKTLLRQWLPVTNSPPSISAPPSQMLRPVDLPRVAALWRELEPLLVNHKFAAVSRFRILQEVVDGTPMAAQIGELAPALFEFRFDEVREALRRMAESAAWPEAPS